MGSFEQPLFDGRDASTEMGDDELQRWKGLKYAAGDETHRGQAEIEFPNQNAAKVVVLGQRIALGRHCGMNPDRDIQFGGRLIDREKLLSVKRLSHDL